MPDTSAVLPEATEGPNTENAIEPKPPRRIVGVWRLVGSPHWERALGELILIVVGVMIGLAVNSWNDGRKQRRLELTMLRQLRATLLADLTVLRSVDDSIRVRERRMEALRADLERGTVRHDSAETQFGAVLRLWEVRLNRSVYESLKARGLDLVSSDALRLRIAALYENGYVNVDKSEGDDRSVVFDVVRPYYLQNFRRIRFGVSATPLSYDTVIRDPYFRNVLDYRLASLWANPIQSIEATMNEISGLIANLDVEIGPHR